MQATTVACQAVTKAANLMVTIGSGGLRQQYTQQYPLVDPSKSCTQSNLYSMMATNQVIRLHACVRPTGACNDSIEVAGAHICSAILYRNRVGSCSVLTPSSSTQRHQ